MPNRQGTFDPTRDRILDDNYELHQIKRLLLDSTDAFGNGISQGTTNEADLAGHYPYSPERYRLFVDDERQQIQYGDNPAQFTDGVDSFTLTPQAADEVVRLRTTERYRYVVQYVIEWSLAFQTNQSLNSGDVWAVGYGDPDLENSTDDTPGPSADGWLVYQNSSHADNEATLAEYRAGTERDSVTVAFSELPQTWGRLAGKTNWYNVGETSLTETYTTTGAEIKQQNDRIGVVAANDGKGPELGNQHIQAAVKAGSTSAGSLSLEVGSIGIRTLGSVQGLLRTKTFDFEASYTGTVGEFEPIIALRVDPDRDIINTQLAVLEPLEFNGSDDVVVLCQVFASENVLDTNGDPLTDSNFTTPPELNTTNSILQESFDVEQVPDSTGAFNTSMPDPGGYQIGYGSLTTTGAGGVGSTRVSSRARTQKRQLPAGDIAVVMARSPSTGDILADIQFEQDW